MPSLRLTLGLSTSLAAATGAVLALSPTASAAPAVPALFQDAGLAIQQNNGFIAGTGTAAAVKSAADSLNRLGVGNTALYTGAGRTGRGIVILTGNDQPEGTDFQVLNLTAAHVQNDSRDQDAVYADSGSFFDLDATVAPGASVDITPVDVDFALYPPGTTPPPDNRGLNPNAQFSWS